MLFMHIRNGPVNAFTIFLLNTLYAIFEMVHPVFAFVNAFHSLPFPALAVCVCVCLGLVLEKLKYEQSKELLGICIFSETK